MMALKSQKQFKDSIGDLTPYELTGLFETYGKMLNIARFTPDGEMEQILVTRRKLTREVMDKVGAKPRPVPRAAYQSTKERH